MKSIRLGRESSHLLQQLPPAHSSMPKNAENLSFDSLDFLQAPSPKLGGDRCMDLAKMQTTEIDPMTGRYPKIDEDRTVLAHRKDEI